MLRGLGILVVASLVGCLDADTFVCGETLCPNSLACDEVHGSCVRPEQLSRCAGRPDGELCQVSGSDGFHCDREVCVLGVCGDDVDDANEECDDGADNSATEPDTCRTTCKFAACGDGVMDTGEACDDGEDNSSTEPDACRDNCLLPRCGDFVEDTGEICDDGNTSAGDGCSPTCFSAEVCGNSLVEFTVDELCDDGNDDPGDGCSGTCQLESGWVCNGEPTVCTPACGDGVLVGTEACDDANLTSADGCNNACLPEMGWTCDGEPSVCDEICGDSMIVGDELCDLGDTLPDDGCSANCLLEFCGNGDLDGIEVCDDGNNLAGDSCSPTCDSDESCGNGVIDFNTGELCDDDQTVPASGDGCSATCQVEASWNCVGQPSACTPICGDGAVRGLETCDDNDTGIGDGCSSTCQLETGWRCVGEPSACSAVCGDSFLRADETCDDGNVLGGDGCSALCENEPDPHRVLAIVDTSGSMHANACEGTFTGGDGSANCPGSDVSPATCNVSTSGNGIPDDARLYFVKEALTNVILSGAGAVEWALMRFAQADTGTAFACPTASATGPSGGWQGAGAAPCTGLAAGELLVPWSNVSRTANFDDLVSWMDHQSDHPTTPSATDEELRATGGSPIAGALNTARTQIAAARAIDPSGSCRPYVVVLVTDSDDTCGGDVIGAATQLFASGVPIHVISLAASSTQRNQIAAAGGTTQSAVAVGGDQLYSELLDAAEAQALTELCNDIDDDCDAEIDEGFQKGAVCDNGELGACLRTGVRICSPDSTSYSCSALTAIPPGQEQCNGIDDDCNGVVDDGIVPACGTCGSPLPNELCNGADDDCDGIVDEKAPGEMVPVGAIWVDKYEASRADATATSLGSLSWSACSVPNRLPWIGTTRAEAATACARQGKRLCTETEWQQACSGPNGDRYPYADQYDSDACNGRDFDPNCAVPDDSYAMPTGTAYGCPAPGTSACISDYGAIDMSGNVAEWTSTSAGGGAYVVRGGSYSVTAGGLRCDFDLASLDGNTSHGDLGFRCCANSFPPLP